MRRKTKQKVVNAFAILYVALIPVAIVLACLAINNRL
jgi:hypothetical protein